MLVRAIATVRPYLGMNLFYGLFYTSIGGFEPFFALYLKGRHLQSVQIGILLAVMPLIGMVAQPLWGMLNDSLTMGKGILFVMLTGAAASMGLFHYSSGFGQLILCAMAFAIFQPALIPLMDSMTISGVGPRGFGKVRLFGSVGYALMAAIAGRLYRHYSINLLVPLYSVSSVVSMAGLLLYPSSNDRSQGPILETNFVGVMRFVAVLRRRFFILLLASTLLISVASAMNMNFFALYYQGLGHPLGLLGVIYAVGGLCELPFFFFSGYWIERFGAERMLLVSGISFLLQWIIMACNPPTWSLFGLQVVGGVSIGISLSAGVAVASSAGAEVARATAQTVYSAVNTGMAVIIGSLFGGTIIQHYGLRYLYITAAFVCALGIVGVTLIVLSTCHQRISINKRIG